MEKRKVFGTINIYTILSDLHAADAAKNVICFLAFLRGVHRRCPKLHEAFLKAKSVTCWIKYFITCNAMDICCYISNLCILFDIFSYLKYNVEP